MAHRDRHDFASFQVNSHWNRLATLCYLRGQLWQLYESLDVLQNALDDARIETRHLRTVYQPLRLQVQLLDSYIATARRQYVLAELRLQWVVNQTH